MQRRNRPHWLMQSIAPAATPRSGTRTNSKKSKKKNNNVWVTKSTQKGRKVGTGSTKGYRMVRAMIRVVEGAWYFEIKVVKLGETGHTCLGWSTEKQDLHAPVGYDGNSFGYMDIDGSKIHKALREKDGEEGFKQGDIIGFYINFPDGERYSPEV